jgi:DNA-binding transcriptional MerR regulator
MAQTLFTIRDAASRIGVSASYVRQLCLQGATTPARDSSGRWLFSERDIDAVCAFRKSKNQRGRR